jgi:hypothetical protein
MRWRTSFIVDGDRLEDLHLAANGMKAVDFSLQRVGDPRANGKRGGKTCSELVLRELSNGPRMTRELQAAAKAAGFSTAHSAIHMLKKSGFVRTAGAGKYALAGKGVGHAKAK